MASSCACPTQRPVGQLMQVRCCCWHAATAMTSHSRSHAVAAHSMVSPGVQAFPCSPACLPRRTCRRGRGAPFTPRARPPQPTCSRMHMGSGCTPVAKSLQAGSTWRQCSRGHSRTAMAMVAAMWGVSGGRADAAMNELHLTGRRLKPLTCAYELPRIRLHIASQIGSSIIMPFQSQRTRQPQTNQSKRQRPPAAAAPKPSSTTQRPRSGDHLAASAAAVQLRRRQSAQQAMPPSATHRCQHQPLAARRAPVPPRHQELKAHPCCRCTVAPAACTACPRRSNGVQPPLPHAISDAPTSRHCTRNTAAAACSCNDRCRHRGGCGHQSQAAPARPLLPGLVPHALSPPVAGAGGEPVSSSRCLSAGRFRRFRGRRRRAAW